MRLWKWQWEARLLPEPVGERQGLVLSALRDALKDSAANASLVTSLQVEEADPQDARDYLLVVAKGKASVLRMEAHRDRLALGFEAESGDDTAASIDDFGAPFLKMLAHPGGPMPFHRRLLQVSMMFVARLDVPVDEHGKRLGRNSDFLTRTLLRGVADDEDSTGVGAKIRRIAAVPADLGRLDLKFCLNATVLDRPADVWIDLQCPANDDYGFLEARTVIQPREGTIPDLEWSTSIDVLCRKFYKPKVYDGVLAALNETALAPLDAPGPGRKDGRDPRAPMAAPRPGSRRR